MLAPRAPQPERLGSYIARDIARLYVAARESQGPFDQEVGLPTDTIAEVLARALFAANRQGRLVEPPCLPPLGTAEKRTWRGHPMTLSTETILGVELTTTRRLMAVLQVLAEASPAVISRWELAHLTGESSRVIPNRIKCLRRFLTVHPSLSISPASRAENGWCLLQTERAS